MIDFTPEEESLIATTAQRLSSQASGSINLNQLLSRYEAFVTEVENGYELTGYDYANDLALRDLLDELVSAMPPKIRDKINSQQLDSLDERFQQTTREMANPLPLAAPKRPRWWWFRMPNDLSGQLATDLLAR